MIRSTATAGLALVLAFSLLPAPPAAAQEPDRGAHSGWELAPFVGGYDDSPEFGPGKEPLFVNPASHLLYGGRFGRAFSSGIFLQGSVATTTLQLNDAPGSSSNQRRDLGVWTYEALAGYNLRLLSRLALFGTVGAGASRWNPTGLPSETDFTLSYGAGARIFLAPWLALRGDIRVHQVPSALGGTKDAVGAGGGSQTFWGWASTGGLSFFLGGRSDADHDGVRDERDACPGTPEGAEVDARGCELDGDDDGVVDRLDRCPSTPAGAVVDDRGCAGDDDGDGVVNGVDRCPSTVSGARVDARGCATDGDGDGVPDGIDRCPDTPAGTEVDETGCPRPRPEPERALEEEGRFTIDSAVHFAFDSAELRSPQDTVLDQVGQALVRNPEWRVRIVGHTDSVGTAAYNRALSLRRARTVRDYLVEHFPSLEASRLEWEGSGESDPVADNGTEEGRRRNRRVEFVVLGREDDRAP